MIARTVFLLAAFCFVGTGVGWAEPVPSEPVPSEPVTSEPSAVRGKQLSQKLCSNCHLVYGGQTRAVADVPSFREIANREGQTEGSVMAKIIIPKHPMPVIPIEQSELRDIAAYVMSLRDPVSD